MSSGNCGIWSRLRTAFPEGNPRVRIAHGGRKHRACSLVVESGAQFVKPPRFRSRGATVEDGPYCGHSSDQEIGVKASGGIRTLTAARSMIEAGANRIGSNSGVAVQRRS